MGGHHGGRRGGRYDHGSVKTTVEPLEGNKVKLSVEVDELELDGPIDAAFRRMAQQAKIPGFRPGKVPRRLLEARLGPGVARQEALRDALPDLYQKALDDNEIEAVAAPDITITSGQDDGPVAFDAVVEVMPEVSVAGYDGLRVVLSGIGVTDADVERQIDRLRESFGELRPVSRPAAEGDHISMDRKVYRHDETLTEVEDELYALGSSSVGPGRDWGDDLDDNLRGAKAGDILKFNITHPEIGEVTFQILVKEIREKILPEVTDEWAGEASEFETVDELRASIREQVESVKRLEAALTVRDKVIEALVELVDEEMPEGLVTAEMERRIQMLVHRLQHQGADLAQYMQAKGLSQEDLVAHLRDESLQAVKADLALKAVAQRQEIEVSDEEVEAEIASLAERTGKTPDALRRELGDEGRLPAVRSGVRKSKALEWLIANTELVDEEGQVIDRAQLTPPEVEVPASAQEPVDEAPSTGAEESTV